MGWSGEGRFVFVQRGRELPAIVERVDLTTGTRTQAGRVPGEAGVIGTDASVMVSGWRDEGRSYAYTAFANAATLFVVTGVGR